MNLLNDYNSQISDWYDKDCINVKDLRSACARIGISYFTAYQYAKGRGGSVSTAESLFNQLKPIVDKRAISLEKDEILNEDLNNE